MRQAHSAVAFGLAAGLAALLPRMRRDFEGTGTLNGSTATAMWAAYGLGAVLYADAVRDGGPAAPAARAAGAAAVVAGVGLTAAGMGAFGSAGKVAGTEASGLETGGVYRLTRNPQYTGCIIAGLGGALASRSALAGALTVGYGLVCAWWVRVEERALEHEYGHRYRVFRSSTPRWLGAPLARRRFAG